MLFVQMHVPNTYVFNNLLITLIRIFSNLVQLILYAFYIVSLYFYLKKNVFEHKAHLMDIFISFLFYKITYSLNHINFFIKNHYKIWKNLFNYKYMWQHIVNFSRQYLTKTSFSVHPRPHLTHVWLNSRQSWVSSNT